MEHAVRHAQTLKAATPAAVWRAISCSQTTAPAKPKMVRGGQESTEPNDYSSR